MQAVSHYVPHCLHFYFMQSANNMFVLRGLQPGTMYELMVCRPGFNISDIPPPTRDGNTPFIAECGFCKASYTTEETFYDFDMTTVTRINDTYVRLVCEVMSNIPQFSVNWSISDPADANERIQLDDIDTFDELPISIVNNRQGQSGLVSTLIAPDSILAMETDIRCMAESIFKSESSESGAFVLVEGNQCYDYGFLDLIYAYSNLACFLPVTKSILLFIISDVPPSNSDFPVWAIILVAVVSLLTVACLLVAAALVVGLVCACSRTRTRKFVAADLERLVSCVIISLSVVARLLE